jgi:uncharacterized membrane protein
MFLTKEQIFGIIRHALTAAGGALVAKGVIDEAGLTEAVGALVTLIGVVWSAATKKNAELPEGEAEEVAAE